MKKLFTFLIVSAVVALFSSAYAQIGTYCSSTATSQFDSKIDTVKLNTINNGSSPSTCELYTDFTSISTTLNPGVSYTITVHSGSCGGSFTNYQKAWIDYDQNGSFDASEQIINTSGPGFNTYSASFTVPGGALPGPTFMRVISSETSSVGPCGTYSYGETEDYAILIPSGAANDVGVTSIDSPKVFCAGTESVVATIRNFGINQVNPVTVNWSVNGFVQSPTTYNQTLDTLFGTGSVTAQVNLGTWNFVNGVADTICVWTSAPNGQIDTVNFNDSLCVVLQPALSGNYFIDTATAPNTFATFTDAAQALSTFGVCGPVNFTVATGTYTEQVVFGAIEGASMINTITFVGDSGAVLQYSNGSSATNYVLQLDGSSHMTFDNLTIKGLGTTYGSAIEILNGTDYNTFKNCVIETYTGSTTSLLRAIYMPSGGNQSYNKFYDNRIVGGYYGVYNYGNNTSSPNMNNEFIGNSFEDQYYYGMYNYYNEDLKIINNTFRSTRNNANAYGIHSYYSYGNAEISSNDINIPGRYGMFLYFHDGDPNDNALIANNMVRIGKGAGTYVYGLYLNMTFARVVNNTIITTPSVYTYAGIRILGGAFNTVMNNNLYIDKQWPSTSYGSLFYATTTTVETSEYNNVYRVGNTGSFGRISTVYNDLAAWQSGTGYDSTSFATDPMISDFDDPRTCSDTLDGAAMPLGYIMYDFEGDNRDPLTPDIGADEFIGSKTFSAGPDAYVCSGKGAIIGLFNSGLDSVAWSTGDTVPQIKVFNTGTYTVSVRSECADTIQSDEVIVTDLTAQANFTIVNDYRTGKFTNQAVNSDSLVWYVGTNPADTIHDGDFTKLFPDNGPYDVTLCVYNDCDTVCTTQQWNGFVGIEDVSLEDAVSISPNPATNNVNIKFSGIDGDITFELHNIQGQLISTERFMDVNGTTVKSINVSSLRKGMYIMKFMNENEVSTRQLIVQ